MKLLEQIKVINKGEWALILLVLFMIVNPILNAETNNERAIIIAAFIALFLISPLLSFLSRKVLKLHERGPIPWYGSPIVIMFGLATCVLVWFH